MPRILRKRPSPAMLVAIAAAVLACAGSATAAGLITGRQIKNGSITTSDIKNNNVRSKDIRNGSLLKRDFKAGQLPAGPQGPAGPRGPAGANGTNGFGVLAYPFGSVDVPSGSGPDAGFVPCAAGLFPTGGDAYAVDAAGDLVPGVVHSQGIDFDPASGAPDGYFAAWDNQSNTDVTVIVDAVCANATSVQAKRRGVHPSGRGRRLTAR